MGYKIESGLSSRQALLKYFKLLIVTLFIISFEVTAQKPTIGAYYYDGWTPNSRALTKTLKDSFEVRKPKWGWTTSTQSIMDEQITLAHDSGLSFFSFCWYFAGESKYKNEPLNNALNLYSSSRNKDLLKYCLMVANHNGFYINPSNWEFVSSEWLSNFKSTNYLTSDGKPIIIFFSAGSLIKTFGSAQNVKNAFQQLEKKAMDAGLKGVTFAACVNFSPKNIAEAESCGFDLLTGYNYHTAGFKSKSRQIPIDSLQSGEQRVWNKFKTSSSLKYIPVATLNWDPRPWANKKNGYYTAPYYVGYSEESVKKTISGLLSWIQQNPQSTTSERIGLVYAWNENGEGAYLTPAKNGPSYLNGLKRAIKAN